MCIYLNKTGSTYYFRRPVPDDLVGHFRTEQGNARTEWKRSLGTKDREGAKRLLIPHTTETNALIDHARMTLSAAPMTAPQESRGTGRVSDDKQAETEDDYRHARPGTCGMGRFDPRGGSGA
jgi:hypothetical protein